MVSASGAGCILDRPSNWKPSVASLVSFWKRLHGTARSELLIILEAAACVFVRTILEAVHCRACHLGCDGVKSWVRT